MTQHINLNYKDPAHEGFFDAIQELLGAASPNFRIGIKNSTTLEIFATTDNGQISIAINGRYRWRTTSTTAALPGGLPDGGHAVYVTATDNDFTGPVGDIDEKTVYTFGLEIKEGGATPGTALYRRVGTVTVKAGAITGFEQTVNSVRGPQIEENALSNAGSLEWTRDALTGGWVPKLKAGAAGITWYPPKIIPGAESRTNVNYNSLTTPDTVEKVVLPPNGLILVAYQALVKSSENATGMVGLFLDDTQVKIQEGAAAPVVVQQPTLGVDRYLPISTSQIGLTRGGTVTAAGDDVTTGQVVSSGLNAAGGFGGFTPIFAAAGTYVVNVQFKASAGSVTAKGRKLWVAVLG